MIAYFGIGRAAIGVLVASPLSRQLLSFFDSGYDAGFGVAQTLLVAAELFAN
ncbi:hypothetical protein AB0H28_23500 [Micromonospora sp. NPDC050980]|uniref:hypothetical protein n=1 Tax=Micromonospora sp. NPDC050980 TaxID=3155161 RepID=UPI0033CCF5E9